MHDRHSLARDGGCTRPNCLEPGYHSEVHHSPDWAAGASTDARVTAGDVKSLADTLSAEAESLDAEVQRFLAGVQAA